MFDPIEFALINACSFFLDWPELEQDFLETKIQKAEQQAAIYERKIALHKAKIEAQKKVSEWQAIHTEKTDKSKQSRW